MFPIVAGRIRRALVNRFPFGVFFVLVNDTAIVIAVMHLNRGPGSWQARA
jgi:hypothetical protein